MFHDAPVEAAVTVHRKPRAATSASSITETYQLHRVVDFLLAQERPFVRVGLQFPDDLLPDTMEVVHTLEELIRSDPRFFAASATSNTSKEGGVSADGKCGCSACPSGVQVNTTTQALSAAAAADAIVHVNPHAPTVTRFYVLADNTFGSCCPDEITALHYHSECIVHFGGACMSRSTRLPVLYIHPIFQFKLISTKAVAAVPVDVPLSASVLLVRDIVTRLAVELRTRERKWAAAHPEATVAPRLVVLGTHALESLFSHVRGIEQRTAGEEATWTPSADASTAVPVDWCVFESREGATESVGAVPYSVGCSKEQSDWTINGMRVPLLDSHQATASAPALEGGEVQYFLFVGPSTALHLVHIQHILQYNTYHYSEAAREYVEEAIMDGPPLVSVLSEGFGFSDTSVGPDGKALLLDSAASVEQVRCCVDAALGEGGLSSLASDGVAGVLLQRRLRQRDFNVETIRASSAVGILVASLAIEGYKEATDLLHKLLRAHNKRSYIIYIGHLNEFKLANFVDTVDCFVGIACPNSRSSHFPQKADGFLKPVVSPAEVLLALGAGDPDSPLYGNAALYTTAFDRVIAALHTAVSASEKRLSAAGGNGAGGSTGGADWGASTALVSVGAGTVSTLGAQGSLSRFYDRSYVGLQPRTGQTAVQTEIAEGKHGVARGYASERASQQPYLK